VTLMKGSSVHELTGVGSGGPLQETLAAAVECGDLRTNPAPHK